MVWPDSISEHRVDRTAADVVPSDHQFGKGTAP